MNLLEKPSHLYIVGIKGVGMTALAQLLSAKGHTVSGSDVADTFFTDAVLRDHHISVKQGFSANNLPEQIDAIIYSTAYNEEHPELIEARRRSIPLYTYPEMLGELFRISEGISVAGTHGKTTTTALLGAMLAAEGRDPTVIVGSNIPLFHGNARIGASKLLVVETDEYQNKLRQYAPRHLVLTNIEYDHPDFFSSEAVYVDAFRRFVERLPHDGILVTNADDRYSQMLLTELGRPSITFGTREATVQLIRNEWHEDRETFIIKQNGKEESFFVRMPGRHNAMNAAAAIAFSRAMDVSTKAIRDALDAFVGITRRFEYRGSRNGVPIFDDYAHHPTEIAAAIAGARERFPGRRIIVIFQPHTYSRTKALLHEFAASLTADVVLLLEVYGSAREKVQSVSSGELVPLIPKTSEVVWVKTPAASLEYLQKHLKHGDVVLTVGAGDVWQIGDALLQENKS